MIMLHLYVWTLAEVGIQPLKCPSVIIYLGFFTFNLSGHEGHVSVGDFKLIIVLPQFFDKDLPLRGREDSIHNDAPLAPIY
jgi:hypothetical protein